ncbi:HIT domain-containing protein [Zooshikella marina]|uniref:HIT domain-containing protein n=1 Tax=Zooshikella ganghwensis TaxID=202772 RepID=A0A4P9VLU5_9GAMM|nr:HIT family protein [Zooshikella ganghwensis]MBU2704702.1 HIT domain-containing protein [Zooshikella ganghwensis]RDH43080.1 HIT domain-containing protein [Zooshikella ganghwensis]
MEVTKGFTLAEQLQQDTIKVGDFSLSSLLLMNDQRYPWFILVPRVPGIEEIYQLSAQDQQQLWWEVSYISEKLKDIFAADKMNIAALGNKVRQLHIHIIARQQSDDAWPEPVWGKLPAKAYEPEAVEALKARLHTVFTTYLTYATEC